MSGPSIARVILYVKDIQAGAAFYERFFNMTPLPGSTEGLREHFLRTTTSPPKLSPTRWKTVLPRSMPIVCSSMGCVLSSPYIPTAAGLKRRTIPLVSGQ
jgi:hypothetical protein